VSVWIQQLPAGWSEAPLKTRLTRNDGGVWGSDPDGGSDTVVLRSTEQKVDGSWAIDEPAKRKLSPIEIASSLLEVGDLLVTKSSGSELHIGKTSLVSKEVADLRACYSNFMQRLRLDDRTEPRYVHYWLNNELCREQFSYLSNSTSGLANLSAGLINEVTLAFPAKGHQERIANFLDDKTARIDALIAEKERLLGLLAEQRLSVSERVIADAANLSRAKLGFSADLLPGFAFSSDEFSRTSDDVPLLRGINVSPGKLLWDETVYWRREYDPSLERFRLLRGDVVLGMDRPWIASGARVAMVGPEDEGALLVQRVCRLRGGSKLRQRYVYYALISDMFRQSIEVDLTGVSVPHISPDQILRFKVPVLSLQEQGARCAIADWEDQKIRKLEEHTGSMLGHLREYRSSLISAAVTGQIVVGAYEVAA
jgi:type I restriction enzyme S subunit